MKKLYIAVACLSIIANVVLCKLYFFPADSEFLPANESEYLSEEEKQWTYEWEMKQKTPDGIKPTSTIQFQEENYRPRRKHLDWLLSKKDTVLADWDYLIGSKGITSVELIGFEHSNQEESVHLIIKESKYLEMISSGLSSQYIRKLANSDMTFTHITQSCPGPFGVLLIHTPEKTTTVGLSCFGFQFGSVDTGSRTAFESWLLAKAIDDILIEKIGRPLNDLTFELVSGQYDLDRQKEKYNDLTILPNKK